jgi:hypothetical protein
MQLSDNIFNERGLLRTDLENVTVPPERRGVFDAQTAPCAFLQPGRAQRRPRQGRHRHGSGP